MAENLIKIFEHTDENEVELVRTALEAAGITSYAAGESGRLNPDAVMLEGTAGLYVDQADEEAARGVLASLSETDPEAAATWKCPKCGEENESSFTECWKCSDVEHAAWECPECGEEVDDGMEECFNCGASRPEAPAASETAET